MATQIKRAEAEEVALPPRRHTKTEVLNIRVSPETMRALEALAEGKGLGASTLARMYLLERIGNELPPNTVV